jgi:hypothetical protein
MRFLCTSIYRVSGVEKQRNSALCGNLSLTAGLAFSQRVTGFEERFSKWARESLIMY